MLASIRLENFKNHEDTTIGLGRITALVGPNNAGKSNVLQALHCVGDLTTTRCREVFQDRQRPELLARDGTHPFCLTVQGHHEQWSWQAGIRFKREKHGTGPWFPDIFYSFGGGNLRHYGDWDYFLGKFAPESLSGYLAHARYHKLNPEALARPVYPRTLPPRLARSGSGLAAVLAHLMTYAPERFEMLQDAVRQVLPQVKRIRVGPARIWIREKQTVTFDEARLPLYCSREVIGHELILDMDGDRQIPAHAAGDGVLVVLGLLTAVLGSPVGRLFLVDDLQQALHSKTEAALIRVLRERFKADETLQMVVATHSSALIDGLEPDSVWHLSTNAQGVVTLA